MNPKMSCKYDACTFEVVSHGPREHYCRVTGGNMKYNDKRGVFVFQSGGVIYSLPVKGPGRTRAKKELKKQLERDCLASRIQIVDGSSNVELL